MKTIKILVAVMVAAAMLLSLAACQNTEEQGNEGDNTTTTTKPTTTTSSDRTKIESDYEIREIEDLIVALGTTEDQVKAKLPATVGVLTTVAAPETSETLFTEDFEDADAFAENWFTVGNDAGDVMNISGGKMNVVKTCNYFRTVLNDQDWMNMESQDYANYVLTATFSGVADAPSNNFGFIFRVVDCTTSGPDGYTGMYVGLGDANGQICIGYADGNWHSVDYVDFDYEANKDYELSVVVYNEYFAVLLDGELVYNGECMYDYGSVGVRTFEQHFTTDNFSVRTLKASDLEYFDDVEEYQEYVEHPVTWTCTDYDGNTKRKYGFIGTVTDLDNALILVRVQVKENVPAEEE